MELGGRECSQVTSNNTLSTDQENYVMVDQLDPGLQYCVWVAARTSAGVGPFAHSKIPCKHVKLHLCAANCVCL